MVGAAIEFRKAGFGDEDAANLALIATMYQNIADQEISAGDAASFIVSQMKAFGIESDNAMHIIDAVNEVSNNFAVSSTDVSTALSKASSAMSVLGNDYEQTIGLVTAGAEIMTGQASKVARGLRTIGNNFANAAQKGEDVEYTVGGVTKSLSLLDETTGDLKPTFEIFKDLKEDWDNMTDAERQALGIAYAGKNQFEVFAAVMSNFETALRASEAAYNSSGSAAGENAKAMESLEGKIRALKAAWEELATGVIGKEFLGGIIDAGTRLLEFANTDMGQAAIKALLFGSAVTGLTGVIGSFASKIGGAVGSLKALFMGMSAAKTGGGLLLGALEKPKWTAIALAIGAVVAIIVGLSHVINDSKSAFDRYMEDAEASQQKMEEYQQSLKEAQEKLEELNETPFKDRTAAQQAEIDELQLLIQQYEDLIALEEKANEKALKKARKEIAKADIYSGGVDVGYGSPTESTIELIRGELESGGAWKSTENAILRISKALGISTVGVDIFGKTYTKTFEQLENELRGLGVYVDDTTHSYEESTEVLNKYFEELSSGGRASREQIKTARDYIEANADLAQMIESHLAHGGELDEQVQAWIESYRKLFAEIQKGERLEKMTSVVDKITGGFRGAAIGTESVIKSIAESLLNNTELGISSVDDLKTALQELSAADIIDFDNIEGGIDGFIKRLQESGLLNPKADVEVGVDDSGVSEELEGVVEEIESQTPEILANIGTAEDAANVTTALDTLKQAIENFPKTPIIVEVSIEGADAVFGTLGNLASYELPTLTQYINVVTRQTGGVPLYPPHNATGTNYFGGGPSLINDGAPVNGSSGELVVANGMATVYNSGEETIQNIPRGAKIYNAADTQKILKARGLTVKDLNGVAIPAMADGTTNNKYPDYRLDPNYSGVANLVGSGETLKENFDNWLKEKKHFLALDIITEAQYYRDLEIMNERYLKNMADYRDDYWSHEEEIYDWRNQALEKQLELEEKLSDLAKAKTQRVLTYAGGRFQYLQNLEAIASAQREVDELRGRYANGTTNARGGLSLVGENGPELRVLKNGDGIIPADATKNLMSLSKFNLKDFIGAAASNIKQYAFNISNLSLPNVQSPEDFIDGLRNMAYQYSFSRT